MVDELGEIACRGVGGPGVEAIVLELVAEVRHAANNEPRNGARSFLAGVTKAGSFHFADLDLFMCLISMLM